MERRTDELRPGDSIRLPHGLVRTVLEVAQTRLVTVEDEPVVVVLYVEPGLGNTAVAGTVWEVLDEPV